MIHNRAIGHDTLDFSVRELVALGKGRHYYDYQSKQCNDPYDAFAKSEYFLFKAEEVHIDNVECNNFDLI